MRIKLIVLLVTVLMAYAVKAQFNYDFTVLQQPYQQLTGATNVNGTNIWSRRSFKMPIPFSFQLDKKTITVFSLVRTALCATDTQRKITGFFTTDAELHDRGNAGGTVSLSPVRYLVEGNAGSRIFKVEVANAGFFDEWNTYSTNNDSLYLQIWLYETTNVVELRYGPHNISHPTDYFQLNGKPLFGFYKNVDLNSGIVDMLYFFKGDPASPTMDSTNFLLNVNGGLTAFPPDGTVYRFAPRTVGINDLNKDLVATRLVQNLGSEALEIDHNGVDNVAYEIMTITGAYAGFKGYLSKGRNKVDISALAAGHYLMRLQDGQQDAVLRFAKF